MTNRKILYGYQIHDGALAIVPEEQRVVRMVYTLYNAGASYQIISDALNRQNIPFSPEAPLWNKHKVKRVLENARYIGKDGYPAMIDASDFQSVQEKISEKGGKYQVQGKVTPFDRLKPYLRCTCGEKMVCLGGHQMHKLRKRRNSGHKCDDPRGRPPASGAQMPRAGRLYPLRGGHSTEQRHQPRA